MPSALGPSDIRDRSKFESFIAFAPQDEVGGRVMSQIKNWAAAAKSNGLMAQWRQNYRLAHNASPYGTNQNFWGGFSLAGTSGEAMQVRINHFRNVASGMMNVVYSKPFATKALAVNSDPDSVAATKIAEGLLQYTLQSKRVNKHLRRAGEFGCYFGTGWELAEWDTLAGEPYVPGEDGNVAKAGDIRIRAKSPLDYYFDQSLEDEEDMEWGIVRDFVNKYYAAEQFPDLADKILALEPKNRWDRAMFLFSEYDSDLVPVYKLFVRPKMGSPNMRSGRYAIIFDDDIVAYDDANPYGCIPMFAVRPSEGLGTLYGYTPMNDVAPLQMFYNLVMSAVATNVTAHAVSSIYAEEGTDFSVTQLAQGMQLLEGPPGRPPPQVLELLATPAEVYNLEQRLEKLIETLSGVNSVARGQPDEQLKSGRALAIVQSAMVQFISSYYASAATNAQDLSNQIIRLYKNFGTVEQELAIVGKDKAVQTIKWKGSSLDPVYSIQVESVDPASQTYGGRIDKADAILKAGNTATPQEILQVIDTGQIETLTQSDSAQLTRIRKENDLILKGVKPFALVTDSHQLDIAEHMILGADPEMRIKAQMNPESSEGRILNALLAHVAEHQTFLMGQIPDITKNPLSAVQVQNGVTTPPPQEQMPAPQGGQAPQQMQ